MKGKPGAGSTLPDKLHRKGAAMLASAVVRQALKEWMAAMEVLKKVPEDNRAWDTVKEVEDFFRSDWYRTLKELSPDTLPVNMIEKLKEMDNDK